LSKGCRQHIHAWNDDHHQSNQEDDELLNLPPIETFNIELVEEALLNASEYVFYRRLVADYVCDKNPAMFEQLARVKADYEDLEHMPSLYCIHRIARKLASLGEPAIYRHIVAGTGTFKAFVGLFEHDPEYPDIKADYVNQLESIAFYKVSTYRK
jgi:hypothetical protein